MVIWYSIGPAQECISYMFIRLITFFLFLLILVNCVKETTPHGFSFKKRITDDQIIEINFPTQFRGKTASVKIQSSSAAQSFLFCCSFKMKSPRSSVVHLRLNKAEAYSPLNHTTDTERLCAHLDRDKTQREKEILGNPFTLDLKATLIPSRSDEIPEGNVTNCKLLNITGEQFNDPWPPFYEKYLFHKNQLKKRIVVLGASTMLDQGNFNPPPYIAEKISDLYSSTPFEIINFSTQNASILDHIMNWERIQTSPERPRTPRSYFPQAKYLPSTPLLLHETFFGIKNMTPDLVVVSSTWNDLAPNSLFFNSKSAIIYDYLITLLEASMHPSEVQNLKLQKLHKQLISAQQASTPFREEQMFETYHLLLSSLIQKIRRDSPEVPILLVTLPFGLNDHFLDKQLLLDNFKNSPLFKKAYDNNFDLAHWNLVEKIQNEISKKVSSEFKNIDFLNLSSEYTSYFSLVAASRLITYNYFLEDFMHFSPAGNLFIATRLEEAFEKMFIIKGKK